MITTNINTRRVMGHEHTGRSSNGAVLLVCLQQSLQKHCDNFAGRHEELFSLITEVSHWSLSAQSQVVSSYPRNKSGITIVKQNASQCLNAFMFGLNVK